MTRHGEDAFGVFGEQKHSIAWFSQEGRDRLFMELDEDLTNRACKTGEYSFDNYCEENPDFDNAMNGVK